MSHEKKTEKFFERGIENYGDFHGNYLNFGLWENGITKYEDASEHLLSRVAQKIDLNNQTNQLDVGCGMGTQCFFFMKTFAPLKIDAIDLTQKHLDLAKQKNKFENITFTLGNACNLPFQNESYSHVTSIEAPINFNTREQFFKEAHRVLKPQGKLGISDFHLQRNPKNWFEQKLLNICLKMWHIPQENATTAEEYQASLVRSGFKNITIENVSDAVYAGYYREQVRIRKTMYKIRGHLVGRAALLIDHWTYKLYKRGLIGYVLVSAQKA